MASPIGRSRSAALRSRYRDDQAATSTLKPSRDRSESVAAGKRVQRAGRCPEDEIARRRSLSESPPHKRRFAFCLVILTELSAQLTNRRSNNAVFIGHVVVPPVENRPAQLVFGKISGRPSSDSRATTRNSSRILGDFSKTLLLPIVLLLPRLHRRRLPPSREHRGFPTNPVCLQRVSQVKSQDLTLPSGLVLPILYLRTKSQHSHANLFSTRLRPARGSGVPRDCRLAISLAHPLVPHRLCPCGRHGLGGLGLLQPGFRSSYTQCQCFRQTKYSLHRHAFAVGRLYADPLRHPDRTVLLAVAAEKGRALGVFAQPDRDRRLTVPAMLKKAGYYTAGVGKWHLGLGSAEKTDYAKPLHPGPVDQGFDYYFGIPASLDMNPYLYFENDRVCRTTDLHNAGARRLRAEFSGVRERSRLTSKFRRSCRQSPAKLNPSFASVALNQNSSRSSCTSRSGPHTPVGAEKTIPWEVQSRDLWRLCRPG